MPKNKSDFEKIREVATTKSFFFIIAPLFIVTLIAIMMMDFKIFLSALVVEIFWVLGMIIGYKLGSEQKE